MLQFLKKRKFSLFVTLVSLSSGLFAKGSFYRPNYKLMHPEAIKKMEKLAAGKYDLRTVIPERMAKGQNGYLIITTKEKLKALKSFGDFVKHKRSRGFRVSVITEEKFNGGIGPEAALNIKNWLRENYKSYNTLYVLILGNPHPREGDTPYFLVSTDKPLKKSLTGHSGYPTDYPYADLHSNWDKNGDGIYAGPGDWGQDGIDGQWDVLVGRIPYYGVDARTGNAEEVDKILERTIRYENERGNLSWRHNIFYNGGVFRRDHYSYYGHGLQFNGALMHRQTFYESGMTYVPEKTYSHVGSGVTVEKLNTLNDGKWGYVHFQGHGFPGAGGGMSSRAAAGLDDKYPKVYTCGACDVASPEHPHNMMYALLRSSGVASYGGTRSVTGCTGPSWLKHGDYYPYFYFANSTGETLWKERSLQAKRGSIGMTNFLINLYGDPSVVPMPQVYGQPIGVSPGWKTRIVATQGELPAFTLPYQVRNNSGTPKKFVIQTSKYLKGAPKSMTLNPGQFKSFELKFVGTDRLPPGTYDLPVKVFSSVKQKREVGVVLDVSHKELVMYKPFDVPAITEYFSKNSSGKEVATPVSPEAVQGQGILGKAFKADQYEAPVLDHGWGSRTSFSTSFFLKPDNIKADNVLINAGMFKINMKGGAVTCELSTDKYSMFEQKSHTIKGGVLKEGWNFISFSVNRKDQEVSLTVNKETKEEKISIQASELMSSRGMTIAKSQSSKFIVDELTVHNYVLNEYERKALRDSYIIQTKVPRYGTSVNNSEVNFTWASSARLKKYQIQVSTSPSFKQGKNKVVSTNSFTMSDLSDGKTYYWRVNGITPKGQMIKGLTQQFVATSKVEKINLKVDVKIDLPKAKVGVSGYNQSLQKFVRGLTRNQMNDTVFSKVSGPSWLLVHSDGTLFTNYGARKGDVGANKFVARVVAPNGQSKQISFSVEVTQ